MAVLSSEELFGKQKNTITSDELFGSMPKNVVSSDELFKTSERSFFSDIGMGMSIDASRSIPKTQSAGASGEWVNQNPLPGDPEFKSQGAVEDPWIDPLMAGSAATGATGKIAYSAGKRGITLAGRAALGGITGAGTDVPIGMATEKVGEKHPEMAMAFNLAVGILSGVTVENAIEKAVIRSLGKKATPKSISLGISETRKSLEEGTATPVTEEIVADLQSRVSRTAPERLAPESSQKTPSPVSSPVSSAGTSETSGQVSRTAPTRTITTEELDVKTPNVLGEAKEPFRMTKDEFDTAFGKPTGKATVTGGFDAHKDAIKAAINAKRITPEEAIAKHKESYPDIETWAEMKATAKPEAKGEAVKTGTYKVGDSFVSHDGTPVKITKINSDGTYDVANGSTRRFSQEAKDLTPASSEQFIQATKDQIAKLRKEGTRLRQEAADYNKSTGGEAVSQKGKVITVPARLGKGGVDIIPFTENEAASHHRKLLESAKKVSAEADLLSQSLPKSVAPKEVAVTMKTVKMEKVQGNENIYRITNVNQSVLDKLGYKEVQFEPGQPQKVFAVTEEGRVSLFNGDVSNELIPFLKQKLSTPTAATLPKAKLSDAPTREIAKKTGEGKGDSDTVKTLARMATDFYGSTGAERGSQGGEIAHKIGSSLPTWFQTMNARVKANKATKLDGISRGDFNTVLNKVRTKGEASLTPRQTEQYGYMQRAIDDFKKQSGEDRLDSDLNFMEKEGYEILGGETIVAGDLNKGDKVFMKGEEYEAKGFTKDGEMILEDGVPVKVDPFDTITIDGIKKAGKEAGIPEVPFGENIETLPNGSKVDWNKVETKEKDGLKGTYYATYNKDGSFNKFQTKTEIDRLKTLEGKEGVSLKQDNYGKQTAVTGKATKGKQEGLGLVVEDPNQPSMFKPAGAKEGRTSSDILKDLDVASDKPRKATDILSDINTLMQNKAGLSIQDVGLAEKQALAKARLTEDMRLFKESADRAGVALSEYLKKQGFDEDAISKMMRFAAVEAKPRTEIIPTESLEGAPRKETTLALKAEAEAIDAELTKGFGDLMDYGTMSKPEQIEMSQQIMDSDWARAVSIAMGEAPPPQGLRPLALYKSVVQRAKSKGDAETIHKLATESPLARRASELGQEIKAADIGMEDDPVKVIQDVSKTRAEKAEKITGKKPAQMASEIKRLSQELEETKRTLDEHIAKAEDKKVNDKIDEIIKPKEPKKPQHKYGSTNKIVTQDRYEKIKAELRQQLSGTKLSAGIDPVLIERMGEIGVYHFEAGAKAFKQWSGKMIGDLGAWVKPHLDDIWSKSKDKFNKITVGEISEKILKTYEKEDFPEIGIYVQKLAKMFVEQGVRERKALINEVHSVLVEIIPKITKRETMDAISGYGKYKLLSKDDISVKLRDLKGQMQQVAKIEDLEGKRPPLKTGVERRSPSDEERRLIKLVEEAKKKYGIQTIDKETQLKSALDAIKTRFTNQIADLETQIKSRQRIVKDPTKIAYDAEATRLKARRDSLKDAFDKIFGVKEMSEQQKINMAIKSVEKSISEYTNRIKTKDLSPITKQGFLSSGKLNALRAKRDVLRVELQRLRDAANPKKTPEQIALQSLKTRLQNETDKLRSKLSNLDFAPKEKKITPLDAQAKALSSKHERAKENYQAAIEAAGTVSREEAGKIVKLSSAVEEFKQKYNDTTETWATPEDKSAYGAARVAYVNYINSLKEPRISVKKAVKERLQEFGTTWKDHKTRAVYEITTDALKTIADNSVSMVATLDNSFIGRQGLFTLYTHPTKWWPAAKRSFVDFAKTLGGKNARDALMAEVYSRPRYLSGEYKKAGVVSTFEEQFPTSMPERVPVLGRAFKASQDAFTGSGLRMRLGVYDLLADRAKQNGVKWTDQHTKDFGKLINSLTARGKWGKTGAPKVVRLVMWAPDMVKGQLDVLTGHNLGVGLDTALARKEAVKNLSKIITTSATIMMVANAIKPGSAETDPRSSDFGSVRIGDTRFDFTGGSKALVVLASRLISNKSKSATTGKVSEYKPGFGKRSRLDAIVDFLANKTNPPASVVRDWLRGRTFDSKPFTAKGAVYNAFTPISLRQAIELKDESSADRVAGVIADVVGVNARSFPDKKKKNNKFR